VDPIDWASELSKAKADIEAALGTGPDSATRQPLFFDVTELLAHQYPPAQWLVQGLLPEKGVALLGAVAKAGKTWLATEIAVAIATGTPAFGEFFARRGIVAYFFAEDFGDQIQRRVRSLLAGRDGISIDRGRLHVHPRSKHLDLTRIEDLAWVVASCRRVGNVDLVVLDPLRNVHNAKENDNDEMGRVCQALAAIGNVLDSVVMVPHHKSPKGGASKSDSDTRGASAVLGAIDCGIFVSKSKRTFTDQGCSFVLDVSSENRSACAAPPFTLKLEVEDEDRKAVKATWTFSRKNEEEEEEEASANPGEEQATRERADDEVVFTRIVAWTAKGEYHPIWKLRTMFGDVRISQPRVTAACKRLVQAERLVESTIPGEDSNGRLINGKRLIPNPDAREVPF
jgi:RecA-family ATPase